MPNTPWYNLARNQYSPDNGQQFHSVGKILILSLLYYRIDRQSLIEYHEVMWDIPPIIHAEVLHMTSVKDYTVHIDSKKRVTLRGALYQYYNVKEYDNGCIILEPRELTVPESISAATLKDMDNAISNFKKGSVSQPIDLSDF